MMKEIQDFDSIQIRLASPEQIRAWSYGEVKKPETINYRTLRPEKDGLFCERIFGTTKEWECYCGKFKSIRYKGMVCDRCGVEVTNTKVRRERMGHINLASPVSHIWYYRSVPSRMSLLLDISKSNLQSVLYYEKYVVTDPGDTELKEKQLLSEEEYSEAVDKYGEDAFKAGMGADAIRTLLANLDLYALSEELRAQMKEKKDTKDARLLKRIKVCEDFRDSGNRPEWMILTVIPVIPPDLRPMVQLDGGRFATSDLNDLYRRVINRNNRLQRLITLHAPDIIIRNEKRMLQEAVDSLIDNGRRGRPVTGPGNRALKSLSDMLKGKQGRFRQNLLGKRVDYSGRSVIVVGPELKIYQCGLPKEMAVELFKPFVMKELVERGLAHNIKNAKRMVERLKPEVWDVLEYVIKDHPVMLNRAPTLHRLGIQAFEPVLIEGRAIKLHPLVCTAFNADFDGDQMAVHLPLTPEAQAEARYLMLSANNLLKPQDGKPVTVPTQDMILGSYYLTIDEAGAKGEGMVFSSKDEAMMAYLNGDISIHAKVGVRFEKEIDGKIVRKIIYTTIGKIIFNDSIPQDLGFVDREDPEKALDLEVDFTVTKKTVGKIISKCIKVHGIPKTAEVLDNIKALGYKYSTKGAITVSIADVIVPDEKKDILAASEAKVDEITKQYKRGLISNEERYNSVIKVWDKATNDITDAMVKNFDEMNPIYMMATSGARGNMKQIRQLAAMRGLMADTAGRTIEIPIRSCFREGMDVLEYFVSAHGARKGLVDTALRTADSGYLTRRLVDVSQDIIVREEDCGTDDGMYVTDIKNGNELIEGLGERLSGRYAAEDIVHPETGEVIVHKNEMITEKLADKVVAAGVTKAKIRTILTCHAERGVCAKCYGNDLAGRQEVNIGEAVGIIAAQSIGEPGTQLTMRTFHMGGLAGGDITQGLPRVEELFEARKPKGLAIISDIAGTVSISDTKKKREVIVTNSEEAKTYFIPFGSRLTVHEGDVIEAGDEITEGSIYPQDIMRIKGPDGVQKYIVQEVQKVYRSQGVDIDDRHIEAIIRQMLKKVKVEEPGDTSLLPGTMVDYVKFEEENAKAVEAGLRPAVGKRVLLGITKASLATDSFLSAASFQETTKVLTEAAIKGKVDPLIGLKENVIIGKLIPAGTGLMRYRKMQPVNAETGEPTAKTVPEHIEE